MALIFECFKKLLKLLFLQFLRVRIIKNICPPSLLAYKILRVRRKYPVTPLSLIDLMALYSHLSKHVIKIGIPIQKRILRPRTKGKAGWRKAKDYPEKSIAIIAIYRQAILRNIFILFIPTQIKQKYVLRQFVQCTAHGLEYHYIDQNNKNNNNIE